MSHRVFKPVILFHDHSYSTDPSGVTHRIHIPYGDPHYTPLIQQKKHKVGLMLQTNGRAWYDIIRSSRSRYKTPKPSSYTAKKRHYYQADSSSDVDQDDDDSHSTMTSSSSSCTTNSSSNNSIASPIPTSKAASTSTTTASSAAASNTMIARKRRGNLPKAVTAVLKQWLVDHCRNPYPTEVEKTGLKDKTGLTLNQISNWFINARRRLLPQILATMHPNHKETNGMLHHHQHHHHTMEDEDDDDGVDEDEEEEEDDEDDMIPMPQPQKRRRKNILYTTNNQQGPAPAAPPPPVVRKRRRYNKRPNAVLS